MMEWMRKNDVFTRLLSLLCAVGLWFYVVNSKDVENELPVSQFPVEFTGVEMLSNNDLIIIEGARSTVAFEIKGKTSKLSGIDLDLVRASADLSSIHSPGTYDIKYQISTSIPGISFNKLITSVRIVVDRMATKSVPVELTLGGKMADGYVLDSYALKPDAITVTAPQSVLDTIVSAKTAYDISSLEETSVATIGYALLDAEGNEVKSSYMSVNTPSVELTMSVRQSGEIPLVLNINDYGFITADDVDIKMEPESIKVKGSPEIVSTLNHIDIGTINLETIFENENFEFELPLILPNGISAEADIAKVKVTVDPKNLEKATIKIAAEDLPQSEMFSYVSDLAIHVWAEKNHVGSLNANSVNIEVSFDSDSLQEGFNELPVKVTALDSKINVIGGYTVVVDVPEGSLSNNH